MKIHDRMKNIWLDPSEAKLSVDSNIPRQLQHTPGAHPRQSLPNYERIPFTACWDRLRGVFQRCVETTLET